MKPQICKFEHIPYANRSTTTFVVRERSVEVWLDAKDRNHKVFTYEFRKPLPEDKYESVKRTLKRIKKELCHAEGRYPTDIPEDSGVFLPLLRGYYAVHVVPKIRACLECV